jgi:voltage-gated potassium channel
LYIYETDVLHTLNSRVGPKEFLWAERTIASILTFEYIMRLVFTEDRKHYITRNRGIIDLLAILPFWIGFFVPAQYLGIIRALRSLRLLKFYRYNEVMQKIFNEFRKHTHTVKCLMLLSVILILLMGCVVHECEKFAQPDKFGTICGSTWYAYITMTTIGYGDMSPVTTTGKVCASMCIFLGVAVYGAWLGIMGSVLHGALDDWDNERNNKLKIE